MPIIDKSEQYYTPEMLKRKDELEKTLAELAKRSNPNPAHVDDVENKNTTLEDIFRQKYGPDYELNEQSTAELQKIAERARDAYLMDRTQEELLQDLREALEAVEPADYARYLRLIKSLLEAFRAAGIPIEADFSDAYTFLYHAAVLQLKGLQDKGGRAAVDAGTAIIAEIAAILAAQPLPKPDSKKLPRTLAAEHGAIVELGHLASYSGGGEMDTMLTSYRIFKLAPEVDLKSVFDAHTGELDKLSLKSGQINQLGAIDTAFLMELVEMAHQKKPDDADDPTTPVSVYLPALIKDPRGHSETREITGKTMAELRLDYFLDKVRPMESFVGMTPNGGLYALIKFLSYDPESEEVKIALPFFMYMYSLKPRLNRLFHASVKTLSPAALEVANRITNGLLRRGKTPNSGTAGKKKMPPVVKTTCTVKNGIAKTETIYATVEEKQEEPEPYIFHVSYTSVLADCPQAQAELKKAWGRGDKDAANRLNKKLDDIFGAAFRAIAEKSDAAKYFVNLTLPTKKATINGKRVDVYRTPTKSSLYKDNIIITYTDINKNYSK